MRKGKEYKDVFSGINKVFSVYKMSQPELRQDPITGIWVIVSEGRGDRPDKFARPNGHVTLPNHDPKCYFCPGNEHLTPPEVEAYRDSNNSSVWWTRTVPNKFPALSLEARADQNLLIKDGMFIRTGGYGNHEVIIEDPLHNRDIPERPSDLIREMWWMLRDRLTYNHSKGLENVVVFKNKGEEAGASAEHPHSQLAASFTHLQQLSKEIEGSQRYFSLDNFMDKKRQCVYCDMVHQELEKGVRIIAENPYFIAFLPFASRVPFETWLVPRNHKSDYTLITSEEATSLADVTKKVFQKLRGVLKDFDYNMVLHSTPLNTGVQESYHYHIEIIPRTTKIAGFELGAGTYINTISPERAALHLNSYR
ncbi:galactose-1-phosphate uridylyltransferase [Candidatus Woesearchaeota archaeon]|nr:galactose-1-phosphate uridylyltransferase [Candidatus Woesearchaeota archaeon]